MGRTYSSPMNQVLAYHSIDSDIEDVLCVRSGAFKRQVSFLRRKGKEVLSLSSYMKTGGGGGACVFTFDDGFRDFYQNAFPELESQGYPATVYLIVNRIGKRHGKFEYLSIEEIRELQRSNLVDFGSHTLSHTHLDKLSETDAKKEIAESKDRLENLLGQPVRSFCYPAGRHSDKILRLALDAGYESIALAPRRDQVNWLDQSGKVVLRTGIYRRDSLWRFAAKTSRSVSRWWQNRMSFQYLPT